MQRPSRTYACSDGTLIPLQPWQEAEEDQKLMRRVLEWRGIKKCAVKKCERCEYSSKDRRNFVVHHRHYRTFEHERPEDVCLFCRPCHDDLHARQQQKKLTLDDIPFIDPEWERVIRYHCQRQP